MENRQNLLYWRVVARMILVGVPIALIIRYRNYGLWLLAGYPIGVVPEYQDLPPIFVILWRLVDALVLVFYITWGLLYVSQTRRYVSNLRLRETLTTGFIMGVVIDLILRVTIIVIEISNGSFRSQFEATIAQGLHPETATNSMVVGIALSIILRWIGSGILASIGTFVGYLWHANQSKAHHRSY